MKQVIFLFAFMLFSVTIFSQNGFYAGYENGGLFDRFHYVNDKGYTLSQMSIGGILGGYVGYKIKGFNVETGFYGFYPAVPFIKYDYNTGEPGKSNSNGSGDSYLMIPLRIGKEFLFAKEKFFVKPEISLNTIYIIDYSNDQPSMGWGEGLTVPGNVFHNSTGDSTVAYGYYTSLWNFALETSLSVGYRFKKRADIYIKWSYSTYFHPLYYDVITHYSDSEIVHATQVNVNATMFQVGFTFYFKKQ